ncbi:MAG: hypothetical protein IJD97_10370 [Clostridia bacterium]|nr:hypothetical protein [Clostridia bacterium]
MTGLPIVKQSMRKNMAEQFGFRGLKRREGARDGDIYDAVNISMDDYPSVSVRKARRKLPFEISDKVYGIGSADKLFWCSGDSSSSTQNDLERGSDQTGAITAGVEDSNEGVQFYYDGEAKFSVEASEKTFSVINKYVCIFPDKMYYSLWGDEAKNLRGAVGNKADAEQSFASGENTNSVLASETEEQSTNGALGSDNITLYESLELLNKAMGESEDIKDGDVYAVGLTEPYSFFQYNSQGEWKDKKDMEEYAYGLQTRWIYLMDSWGSLESVQSSFATRTDGILDMYKSSDGIGYDTFEAYKAEKTLDLNSLREGDTVEIRVEFYDSDTKESIYKRYIAKLSDLAVKESDFDEGAYYYRYCFSGLAVPEKVDGEGKESTSGPYVRYMAKVKRVVPDLTHTFCHDNRLWGIDGDKICASKLGDPFNFQDYSTIADASWAVGVASSGPFTGGIAYNGYPTFFKEDRIIRVSGDYPSQYSTFETADIPGVMKGSGKSLAVADGVLYYLSPEGVCAYTGSYPTVIGDDIGEVLISGYGGAGGDKYYLEAEISSVGFFRDSSQVQNDSWGRAVYVYDTKVRAWTKEDALNTVGFTDIGRDLYALTDGGIYLLDSVKEEGEAEEDIESVLEFAPIYDGHLKKKGVSRIHLSIRADTGAEVRFLISYDKESYKEVMKISPSVRRNYNIPLTVRRCGFYQLKIMAKGGYTLYGISRERYFGSEY